MIRNLLSLHIIQSYLCLTRTHNTTPTDPDPADTMAIKTHASIARGLLDSESNKEKALARLKRARAPDVIGDDEPERKKRKIEALSSVAALRYEGVKKGDLAKLKPPDEYETEMHLMAEVDAYFKVAYKRIIDSIPRTIDSEVFQPLPKAIGDALITELQVFEEDSQARCRDFLEEAPDTADLRKDLMVRKARLGDAKVALRKFKMK